jgi:hypothetical protein
MMTLPTLLKQYSLLGTGDKIAIIATFVGFLQFVILVITWRVMRRSARRQLRAYVSAVVDFMFSFDDNHLSSASFTMKNVGQTPAYRLTHRTRIIIAPEPLPQGFKFSKLTGPGSPPIVLFPNVPFNGTKTADRLFSTSEIASIRENTSRIYIYGEIRYRDVFGRRRWTKFSQFVSADIDTLSKLTSNYGPSDLKITFRHTSVGNDAS